MHKLKVSKVWIPAFLLAALVAGCGDPDKAGSATSPLTPPTVTAVNPTGTLVCNSSAAITATFSKAMNPATINATTFTLTGPSGSVLGAVAYIAATNVATFTPDPPGLAVSTTYTATITTGAEDAFGNHLAADKVWTFTTATCSSSGGIPLGTACGFGILAGSTVTNSPIVIGTTTHVTGDVGVSPGLAITGFPPGTATGPFFSGVGSLAGQAQMDLTTAYNAAAGAANTGGTLTGDIGGQTKLPGVYTATTSLGITGNLTLDGGGDPNATWIFQVGSTLTTAAGNSQVLLINGATAHNVFWQVGSSATLGTNTIFQGTIMAQASITLTTGATLDGRALARSGAVTLDSNAVNVPPCP